MKRNTPLQNEQRFYTEIIEFSGKEKMLVYSFIHKNCDVCVHTHDFYEVNIVVNGRGIHYIGEMEIPVTGGEIFVLPPNVPHGYECHDSLGVEHIIIKTEFLKKYADVLEGIPGYSAFFEIEPYLRQVNEKKLFLQSESRFLDIVRGQVRIIREQAYKELYTYQAVIALKLICDLCIAMSEQCNNTKSEEIKDSDILRVMEFIHMHFSERLSINTLAKIANMSRPTFHRHFTRTTRMTPVEYITKCRINEARKLLEKGDVSRAEIAQLCGFYDTSHMNKYFGQDYTTIKKDCP